MKNILGAPKEKRTQLYFRDDGKFTFRSLLIEDTFLVEKSNGEIKKGWKHFFQLQFPFAGLTGIKADMVLLGGSRDIILDPYGIVDDQEKPDKHKKINENPWITQVAESRIYKHSTNKPNMIIYDKITLMLGALTTLMVLGILFCVIGG